MHHGKYANSGRFDTVEHRKRKSVREPAAQLILEDEPRTGMAHNALNTAVDLVDEFPG